MQVLGQRQTSRSEARADHDPVVAARQFLAFVVRETESPVRFVEGRAIRHPIRMIGERVQTRLKVRQRHHRVDRGAVSDHMQVALAELGKALAVFVLQKCFVDRPLVRHGPVEHLGCRGHLVDLERNDRLEMPQRCAQAGSGNASGNGNNVRTSACISTPVDEASSVIRLSRRSCCMFNVLPTHRVAVNLCLVRQPRSASRHADRRTARGGPNAPSARRDDRPSVAR